MQRYCIEDWTEPSRKKGKGWRRPLISHHVVIVLFLACISTTREIWILQRESAWFRLGTAAEKAVATHRTRFIGHLMLGSFLSHEKALEASVTIGLMRRFRRLSGPRYCLGPPLFCLIPSSIRVKQEIVLRFAPAHCSFAQKAIFEPAVKSPKPPQRS